MRAIPGTCASDGRGEDFVGFLCGARLATGVHFGEIIPQLTRIALAADVNTLAPGAGRIPGTSVLAAVLARRAVSAQPLLPTYLVIFGLTAQPGGKKAMAPLSVNRPSRMGSSPSDEGTRTVFIGSPD